MPWYKFVARYGKGRETVLNEYRWYDEPLSIADLQSEWEYVFRHLKRDFGGDALPIDKLPEEERLRKIKEFNETMSVCRKMLRILGSS